MIWTLSNYRLTRRSSHRLKSGLFAPYIFGTRIVRDCYSSLARAGVKRSRSNSLKSCPPVHSKVKAKVRPISARADRLREAFACSKACAERVQPAVVRSPQRTPSLRNRAGSKNKIEPALCARAGSGLRPGVKAPGVFFGACCILNLVLLSRPNRVAPGRRAARAK